MANTYIGQTPSLAGEVTERWKGSAAAVSAVLLGIIYLVSGGWKLLLPFQAGELLEQAQVPAGWGTLGASTLGALEVFTAVLLFLPKYRRIGGLLGSALMVFFIGWIAFYYGKLVGHECSCFPLIKRTVGPGFFISDAVMLLFGLAAAAWSTKVLDYRRPALILAAVLALAGISYGVNHRQRAQIQVPSPIAVDGKPADLTTGKVFLFFYDPECSHCDQAAKFLSKQNWQGTRVVAVPTHDPQYAAEFLHDTHLKAGTSLEATKLKKAFPFVDPPFGVALEDGAVKQSFGQAQFNEPSPATDLRKLGFLH